MEAVLSNENINLAIEKVNNFFKKEKVDRKKLITTILLIEEALIEYQKAFGETTVFTMDCGHFLGSFKIRLKVRGQCLDPFAEDEENEDIYSGFLRNIDAQFGNKPRWNYVNNTNTVTFVLGKIAIPDYVKMIVAIAGGVLAGIILRMNNEPLALTLQEKFFTPIGSTVLGLINAVAILMIFCSVIWGICSIGDVRTFGEIGKKLFAGWLMFYALAAILSLGGIFIGFNLNFGQTAADTDLASLFQMLLDIVPKNLFTPFTEGNTLQVLFIAIIFGIALIILGDKVQHIAMNLEQLNFLAQDVMKMVVKLIPLFIFCSMYQIAASSNIETLKTGGKFFLFSVIGMTLIFLLHFAFLMLKTHLSPLEIFKKSGKTMFIGFTTASSAATLSENMRACVEDYHVKEEFVRFASPLVSLVHAPATMCFYLAAVCVAAESSGMPVSLSWIMTALMTCLILSAATPPVSGGPIACFALAFTQLGLPQDNLAVIMALTVILDIYNTTVKVFINQCLVVVTAETLNE